MIVLVGEDSNDCRIVAEILREHHPDLSGIKLLEITDKVRLKAATGSTLADRVRTVVAKAKGRAKREKAELMGVIVHEDLDGVTDQQFAKVHAAVAAELSRHCPVEARFALAAWESEAWLLLFPDAFKAVRPAWKLPASLRGKNTGLMVSPKEELKRRLGTPTFRESDGPLIARKARELGLLRSPDGTNRSYDLLVESIEGWQS